MNTYSHIHYDSVHITTYTFSAYCKSNDRILYPRQLHHHNDYIKRLFMLW